ncbi:MAG TPA: glycoside hydrolase family 28 protein [Acidobacteriaceae bacterium]|nr:glycoside hydrolase family 28 protein [Acidobacteriaceae bacterium]
MKIQARICLAALLALSAAPVLAAKVCDVRKYGAKGDGTTKDTKAIQAAIDACSKNKKGGTVKLSGGTFVSAPLDLKSNITLDIEAGTTLLGSPDHDDYPTLDVFRAPGRQSLLHSDHAENIVITGGGVIDGNGASWWRSIRGQRNAGVVGANVFRPRLVVFNYSKHIRMENVTVQNSPSWQIVPYYSDDVVFRNMKVLATLPSPNTDAIDPFSSSNIVIDHVYADVGDDNVAIKSGEINSPGPDSPSTNITITDCTFDHGHGVSIGSEIAGGVQHVHVERVHFKGTDQGIRIKANRDRGNDVSDITFKDIDMDHVKTSILITEYYPRAMPEGPVAAEPVQRLTPHFHNIRIENVKSTNSPWAGVIVGLPESHVTDIELKNVDIEATKGFQVGYADVKTDNFKVTTTDGSKPITLGPDGVITPVSQ